MCEREDSGAHICSIFWSFIPLACLCHFSNFIPGLQRWSFDLKCPQKVKILCLKKKSILSPLTWFSQRSWGCRRALDGGDGSLPFLRETKLILKNLVGIFFGSAFNVSVLISLPSGFGLPLLFAVVPCPGYK